MNWLSDGDMLPAALPKPRIFTYDWNANYFGDAPVQTLLGHADTLLGLVAEVHGSQSRPIIFIASCFGGLIVAEVCSCIMDGAQPLTSPGDQSSGPGRQRLPTYPAFYSRSCVSRNSIPRQ